MSNLTKTKNNGKEKKAMNSNSKKKQVKSNNKGKEKQMKKNNTKRKERKGVKQVKYCISPGTRFALQTDGCLKLDGSIGKLIESKKDMINIDMSENKDKAKNKFQAIKNKTLPVIKNNKGKTIAVVGIVTGLVAFSVSRIVKKPRYAKNFENNVDRFIYEMTHGELTEKMVDDLMDSTIELKKHKRLYRKISSEYFETLINCTAEYTKNFLKKNDVNIKAKKTLSSEDKIIEFANYLGELQRVFALVD